MQSESTFRKTYATLDSKYLGKKEYQIIFEALDRYYATRNRNIKHDQSEAMLSLIANKDVSSKEVANIFERNAPVLAADGYISALKERGDRIAAMKICSDLYGSLEGEDASVSDVFFRANKGFLELMRKSGAKSRVSHIDTMNEMVKERDEAEKSGKVVDIPSGFVDIDKYLLGGYERGTVGIVTGTPGTGKTVYAMNVGWHVASVVGERVDFFSIEMTKKEMSSRLLTCVSGIPNLKCKTSAQLGAIVRSQKEIFEDSDKLWNIHTETGASPNMIRRTLSEIHPGVPEKHGLVIIDYLGLMRSDNESKINNTNDRIGDIMRELKDIAKDFDVAILLLCQMNRQKGYSKREEFTLDDLRDSGNIGQDAHTVMFLDKKQEGATELRAHIVKNRGGTPNVSVSLWSEPSKFKLTNAVTRSYST
jgi:replicative DNA helicase